MGLALIAASCRGDGHGGAFGPFSGELGYARFDWRCTGSGDLACEPDYEESLSQRLAVGSRFDLSFGLVDGVPSELDAGYLVLASAVGVRASSFDYEVTGEGRVTLLALTSSGEVADFLRFEARAVDELRIVYGCDAYYDPLYDDVPERACGDWVDPVQPRGETLKLRVEPYGDGSALMGDLGYTWEVSPPERLVKVGGAGNGIEVELREAGPAQVRVRHGELEQVLELTIDAVVVDSSGPKRKRSPSGETDGETDTDTGTDTGTTGGETDTDTEASTGSSGGTQ